MSSKSTKIRPPAVAGQFYPGSVEALDAELERLLTDARVAVERPEGAGKTRALISPHAGYVFSGPTAAKVFSLVEGNAYKRALILAPSHRVPFSGVAVPDYDSYATPIGDLSLDLESLTSLRETPGVVESNEPHELEHSLEVQLPFLVKLLPEVAIVPLVCGHLDASLAENIAGTLVSFWNDETLWVISSDFTHYGRSFGYLPFTERVPEQLKSLDAGAVERILDCDCEGFIDYLDATGATICGANPIRLLLKTIERAGAKDALTPMLVELTSSGESTGDFSHCVGYAGVAFFNCIGGNCSPLIDTC